MDMIVYDTSQNEYNQMSVPSNSDEMQFLNAAILDKTSGKSPFETQIFYFTQCFFFFRRLPSCVDALCETELTQKYSK